LTVERRLLRTIEGCSAAGLNIDEAAQEALRTVFVEGA
jgi:hypothetical protein